MRTLRAVLVPLAALVLLWLTMPGASFVRKSHLATPDSRAAFHDRWGEPLTSLNVLAGELQRIRLPIAAQLGGFQPVFRISQSWHLYRDGPRPIRRMEVWVDGDLKYRTEDDVHNWRATTFRNRRIRPMAESLVIRPKARNRLGLGRAIVRAAIEDFPGATVVEIRSTRGQRRTPGAVQHFMRAESPDWQLEDHK